ncbi:neutral zinc metallopeptidase [Rhizobium lentis]|uniref:neutral zinc metallopeptidase n=1 Tax=Rhizobium lentis TaxID=1138194 RepID=UPI001C83B815|nr:neutral zinc metallopeptidase [Rhizobium lentis]MBX5046981.1 hypothetical protein [Rhizobium lentis]MBX5058993.1 hypothetical protein [Rhizobium lentis]MBX5144971.1 hypothetical protein [Rhizobium lentis]
MLSRRSFLIGGVAAPLFSLCICHAQQFSKSERTPNTFGCWLADQDVDSIYPQGTDTRLFASGNEPMIPRSGDKDFDYALAHTLAKISSTFDVLPGFAYYDDYDGKNAYATPTARLSRADGTVLFGQGMLADLRASGDHPEIAVTAVCAHEFGHILQYKHNLMDPLLAGQNTVKRVELQADFFAGYFAGIRKREKATYAAAVVAATQARFGDNAINDRDHHGTNQERGAAVVDGFRLGSGTSRTLSEVIQIANNYALSL